LNLRAQPADTLLNYTYSSGKIIAVDNATIDWDPAADDRVHTIADVEIQQSGGIGNAPANGTVDAQLRITHNRNRSILSAGTLTVTNNAILNVDTTATGSPFAAYGGNGGYLTNGLSSGFSVASLVGSQRLTKWGDGTLYVRGDSSAAFSGPVVIDQGALHVTHNGSLGTGALTVNRYGVLDIGVANFQATNSSTTYNEGSIERWSVNNARTGTLNLGKGTLQIAANQPTTNVSVTLDGGGIGKGEERGRPAPSSSTLIALAGLRLAAVPSSRSSCPVCSLAVVPVPIRSLGASAFRRLFGTMKPSDFSRLIIASLPRRLPPERREPRDLPG
jgi:autotransporter-associated beta strand protein